MEFDPNNNHIKWWRDSPNVYLVIFPTGEISNIYKTVARMGFTWDSWIAKATVEIVEIDPEERICWVDYLE